MIPQTTATLSDYEQKRAVNIARNNDRLRALGLISKLEEERSNAAAWGEKSDMPALRRSDDTTCRKKKCTTKPSHPARKSRRLEGGKPEHVAKDNIDDYDTPRRRSLRIPTFDLSESECNARVLECREARQRAALEIEGAGDASKDLSASYAHSLMRVRSMTEKALASRVKAIERAKGKNCVVKMATFKSCLQDEGMFDLAKAASEALERLKALESPPK